jgi:hypothetical protein
MTTLVTLASFLPAFAALVVAALFLTLAQDLWAGWQPQTITSAVDPTDLPEPAMCRLQPEFQEAFERQMALGRIVVQLTVMTARFVRAVEATKQTITTWVTAQVTVPSLLMQAPLARPVRAVAATHSDGLARLRLAIH